jgi:Lrp/AsnC family transcriptional regulator, regulator for asnA, asnC and gidA
LGHRTGGGTLTALASAPPNPHLLAESVPSAPSVHRKLTSFRALGYDSRMAIRAVSAPRRPALDNLDKAIIKALQLDGRRPYAQIGRELRVPEATVRQRAERLIARGIVQVVGVTDPLAMGFQQPAFIGLKIEADRLEEIADRLADLDEVTYVVVTAGRYDLICEVVCEDNDHLLRVLTDKIARIDGIRSTETMVELRFVKESYRWGTR